MSDALDRVLTVLHAHPDVALHLSLRKMHHFIVHTARLKNDIILTQPATSPHDRPPQFLPPVVKTFLSILLNLEVGVVEQCWGIFKDLVWDEDYIRSLEQDVEEGFRSVGVEHGLTSTTFYPPSHFCTNLQCDKNIPLKKAEQRAVLFYTLDRGVLPAHSIHLYCPTCNTNYHHNFSVRHGVRQYYGEMPDALQVAEHHFVQKRLIDLWVHMMVTSWTSAGACATTYNETLATSPSIRKPIPASWTLSTDLRNEHVWDAFVLKSLLEDCHARGEILELPHTGEQKDRFVNAMQDRNIRIQRFGQASLAHRCNKCTRLYQSPDGNTGKVSCVVIDGVTVGHPCCSVHNCQQPLASSRDRFCPNHEPQRLWCCIIPQL